MTEAGQKYVPLADDLTTIIANYESNPWVPEAQRQIWKAEGRKQAITHGMLGKDHPNALQLLEELGYDGQPVGSLKQRSAESFWFYNDNHVFPPEDDLIRFGLFFHLDLYRLLALVLKGKWEAFYARELCEWKANVGRNLSDVFEQEEEMKDALTQFNPDTHELLSRLLSHGNVQPGSAESPLTEAVQQSGESLETLGDQMVERMRESGIRWLVEARYGPEAFDTLVQRMLLDRIHWVATDSRELAHFSRKAVEEIVIWVTGTEEERQRYWMLNQARLQLLLDLDELYLQIERKQLENERVHYKYLNVFGEYEIALKEAMYRHYELEQKVLLKQVDPELSSDELDEQIRAKIEEMEDQLDELKQQAAWAPVIDKADDETLVYIPGIGGVPIGPEEKQEYLEKCKKLLRQIHLLVHPDRLQHDPVYAKLTPEQKDELDRIMKETSKIKARDLLRPSSFIESRYRSPDELQSILDRIKTILRNAGIDTEPDLEVPGETLPERLRWLEKDIERQERYLDSAKVELQALMTSDDIRQKQAILANEAQHEEIKNELQQKTDEYNEKADELQAELDKLMEEAPA